MAVLEKTRSENSAIPAKSSPKQPRIVIIGGGFAGIAAARALRRCAAEVLLIDRRNHHTFQPLLYQVATSVLASSEIAAPIRQLAEKQRNVSVMLAEVTNVDLQSRWVEADCGDLGAKKISFDYLVVAIGVQPSYFGHDEFAKHAPSLKTITDAEAIRTKILRSYELAEMTNDPAERTRRLTFVLVGGGPTGVELAASIATMAKTTLRRNFRHFDPANTSILLIEAGQRILAGFSESLSKKAAMRLNKLGVKVMSGTKVEHVDEQGVTAGGTRIESATVLWTAGVAPSPLLKMLTTQTDHAGRARVSPFLNLPENPRVFVAGDSAAATQDGHPLPGVAQVAIQQGRYAGHFIASELEGCKPPRAFRYFDKGSIAVVGSNFAVLEAGRVRMSGFIAWWVWVLVHLMFLPQLQNRLRVQTQWFWTYLTGQRGSRLISEAPSLSDDCRRLPQPNS